MQLPPPCTVQSLGRILNKGFCGTCQVYLVSEQRALDITSLWGDTDVAVVFWARSMGCFFCQCVCDPPSHSLKVGKVSCSPHHAFLVVRQGAGEAA